MAKLTLTDLASLANATTAINAINANSALIETAMENTLSRDGTSPNTMSANIDMNSNDLLNVDALNCTSITVGGSSITSQVAAAAASATAAAASATTAASSATSASSSASAAAASDVTAALQAAALVATSTTSLLIAVASKTFTTQASKSFAAGQFIIAVSAANSANFMHGQVTSYSGTTLVVDVQSIGGSGTLADWNLSVSGNRGATGATGATGSAGTLPIAAAAGTVDAITANYTPDVTLTDQMLVALVSSGANTSATPSFTPDGLTTRTIVKGGGLALVAGDIGEAGAVHLLEYNLANTRWELLNPFSVITAAAKTILDDATVAAIATTLGLGTASNPEFATLELGHASDTTFARVSAGVAAVEGKNITLVGGTDVVVADGGTGVSALTSNNLVIGAGTSPVTFIAPGTSGNILTSNGTVWASSTPASGSGFTVGTAVATTSGASASITGIPAGTKVIHMNLYGVSVAAVGDFLTVQLGDAGGLETTGYTGTAIYTLATTIAATLNHGTGWNITAIDSSMRATQTYSGQITLVLEKSASFKWTMKGSLHVDSVDAGNMQSCFFGGIKTLSAELTQLALLADGAFDAGEIQITYS